MIEQYAVAAATIEVDAEDMRGELEPGRRSAFMFAGDAILTIRSTKTQTRFTYRVTKSKPTDDGRPPVWFVSLLSGADNEGDYRYIGTIFANGFRTTARSSVRADAPSAIAFAWFESHRESAAVKVWHEGRCGRCGRTLTVPESIASGIGPVCAGKD